MTKSLSVMDMISPGLPKVDFAMQPCGALHSPDVGCPEAMRDKTCGHSQRPTKIKLTIYTVTV